MTESVQGRSRISVDRFDFSAIAFLGGRSVVRAQKPKPKRKRQMHWIILLFDTSRSLLMQPEPFFPLSSFPPPACSIASDGLFFTDQSGPCQSLARPIKLDLPPLLARDLSTPADLTLA